MTEPNREDLLGYVLGALDAEQQQNLQKKIDSDTEYDDELLRIKSQLAPLELISNSQGPRAGLARRTCEMVAATGNRTAGNSRSECYFSEPVRQEQLQDSLGRHATWSKKDLLVMAASLAIVASLLFPVISYARHQANLTQCARNLQTIGFALASFSEIHDGKFVEIPSSGPLSFAGVVAPVLKEADLIVSDNVFTCQAINRDKPFIIPSTDQIRQSVSTEQGNKLRRLASGDFGYTFGYMDGQRFVQPRNLGRDYVVIAADKPSVSVVGEASPNHGGVGQNCLFEDMHVAFIKGNTIGEDQIYVNAYNVVGPGVDPRDSVIGSSHLSPLSVIQLNSATMD